MPLPQRRDFVKAAIGLALPSAAVVLANPAPKSTRAVRIKVKGPLRMGSTGTDGDWEVIVACPPEQVSVETINELPAYMSATEATK